MCIFCEIIKGNIPSKKVYEDNDVVAILDISQATKGHTLVIPKKHYANILEIEYPEYENVMIAVKKVCEKINVVYKPEGFNILNNCGEAAGQTVNHFHVHILPRYNGDDLKIEFKDHSKDINLDDIAKDLE